MITAANFRSHQRNSLQGFLDLHLDSGLTIHDCVWHKRADGREWIGFPGRPQTKKDGTQRKDANGKPLWSSFLEIKDKRRNEQFQKAALDAVHRLVNGGA